MIHEHYPSPTEVDQWCRTILEEADAAQFTAEKLDRDGYSLALGVRHTADNQYVRFAGPEIGVFYGYWQPAYTPARAPLLVHVPGYGAEMSAHPELVAQGYNVLHVNPLGYCTPDGLDLSRKVGGEWPVLPDVVTTFGRQGYRQWLRDAMVAIRWARQQPGVDGERLGFFGSSQGGGGALLLGSLMRDRGGRAVAADVPFLTNFPLMYGKTNRGAYRLAFEAMEKVQAQNPSQLAQAWKALGFVDTLNHAHRLTMPVLLTAGQADSVTPADSIRSLFDRLPATRSYTELAGQGHAYTPALPRLAGAWFGMYV